MPIDPKLLKNLAHRRAVARAAGGNDKLEARRAKGLMTARDRVEALFQPGTFLEMGQHAQHDCHNFGMDGKPMPGDGVITGVGLVDGRPVAVFSQDFTVGGGALGRIHSRKISDMMEYALRCGMPVVGFNDSGGARIQEGVESLAGYGQVFFRNVLLSGVVPQIAVIAGPCAGGAAYSPALMDFLIMVRKTANMFICGPEVIKAATGQKADLADFATAEAHAAVSGNIHFIAENDAHAVELVRKLLSYLPPNNLMDPPHHPTPVVDMTPDPGMNDLVPSDPKQAYNVLDVITRLVDAGDFFEVAKEFAKNIVVGFARIQGIVVGIVANQPMVKAGTLDIDSSDKAARFIRFCNVFNIPLVTLVDVPGFLPGLQQERGGIIRHGAKMLFAYASATVPKITVIMRKAYGGAYLAMCSQDMGADFVYAWPTAEIAVMGAEGAVKVLYKKEIAAAPDPKAKEAELQAEYRDKFCSPYEAASKAMITDVIEPAETRAAVAMALRNTLSKRETRPPKKHGTIPL
ncbi:acyl-CoA carboxylase subunit beta [Fontisphaera persica]|uniref:acyl-CoA carboxylase subunit beta n=1 Tax=Fontisphaera persica TaxID=2974023 RepID=UPI0024C073A6|nr:acyl-CoA carboxylase subunit beta [Fontisphaera persica]WCJ59348.1 acyl-CoA carboxylase subunit beta [Fontisphaera persica]